MYKILGLIIILFASSKSYSQTGISNSVSTACDGIVTNFMSTHNIPGLSFALAKDGKLVYMRGFGESDLGNTTLTYPHHLFRIASISKPITSIAIMKLLENGQLSLSDRVFGPTGILASHPYLTTATITDTRINDITVQHLLEHSAGWNRSTDCFPNPTSPYPYFLSGCDPIIAPLHVTQEIGAANPASEEGLIFFLLEKGLDFTPGTDYHYSNIGYLMLGEVIETLSGMSYEEYVKTTILEPIGACDTHLGNNLLADKQEREMEYVGNGYTNLDVYGNNVQVPWEYGGTNIEAMSAHGGWISTARDLIRILVAVDNFSTKPDILNSSTISTMVTPSANNANYAKGWNVNVSNNWWHTGALWGSATFFGRSNSGYTWAILLNKRVIGTTSSVFRSDLDNLPWDCIAANTSYPSYDLLNSPSIEAKDLSFQQSSATACNVQWQSGNGMRRVVVAKLNAPVDHFPIDGQSYTANSSFGSGSDLGSGNYVVYDGPNNNTAVTGLNNASSYYFRVFEYNQNTSTGNFTLYNLSKSSSYQYNPSDCPDNLSLPVVSVGGLYEAKNSIISTATIAPNTGAVTFHAGSRIDLKPGMWAKASNGHQLRAEIENCQ